MKLKHVDLVIPPEEPFANCKLDRKQYAEVLTNIVVNYADGFVMAINNVWGTGKTTFVRMWNQQMKNEGFETLYFNAWENDFENGALAALMAELGMLQKPETKKLFKQVLKTGAKLAKSAIPILIKAAAVKYLDKEVLKELFDGVTDSANEMLHEQIEDYTSKKKGLIEFKKALQEFAQKTSNEKPIIIIIDELDRCRPNYAVEVLEKVKHFFDVPGIVFILSIDKTQLANAVRGVYGSDRIDADEYLKRFIDVEYSIPEPVTEKFSEYLLNYFDFNSFFHSQQRLSAHDLQQDEQSFRHFITTLFENKGLTLRQQEKFIAHTKLVINSFGYKNYIFPSLLILLIYIKQYYPEIYTKIRCRNYTMKELLHDVEEIYLPNINEGTARAFIYAEASLIALYHNYYKKNIYSSELYRTESNGIRELQVTTKINDPKANTLLKDFTDSITSHHNYYSIDIDYLIKRIDLLEPIRVES